MDRDDVQNRFTEAPDLEGLRRSSRRPSFLGRLLSRTRSSLRVVKSPTFITAVLALLVVGAIALWVLSIT